MADWDDVRRVVRTLPEAVEGASGGSAAWRVRGALFAWERPLRAGDVAALGAAAPTGQILAVRVADEGVKHALIADDPAVFFTTPHFEGYPTVLVQLDHISADVLHEVVTDAWRLRAPVRLQREFDARP